MAADSRNGNGLRAVLEANSPGGRGWLGRMTVLAPGNDPFRADTDSGHRNGAWLAEQVREFGLGDGTIHLRGIHYALVDRHTRRPDTLEPYENNDSNWTWLQGTCGKQARWLGYVGFDQIHDERNAEPVVRIYKEIDPVPHLNVGLEVEIPDAEDLVPTVGIEGFTGRQPFKLVFLGEKSSLEPVLGPLAEFYKADLYLPTGNISDTLIYQMAKIADTDGRRMVLFYFSDCDPSGYTMPAEVARKLQAFKAALFPGLDFEVRRVALTPAQVKSHGLPSSFLKDTEKRKGAWIAATGVEQTEIDALSTLRRDLLREITREAVDPFFDRTLAKRVAEAKRAWLEKAQAKIAGQLDGAALAAIRAEAEAKLAELRDQIGKLNRSLQLAVPDEIEFPAVSVPEAIITSEQTAKAHVLPSLINSDWSFAEQTERLIAAKAFGDV